MNHRKRIKLRRPRICQKRAIIRLYDCESKQICENIDLWYDKDLDNIFEKLKAMKFSFIKKWFQRQKICDLAIPDLIDDPERSDRENSDYVAWKYYKLIQAVVVDRDGTEIELLIGKDYFQVFSYTNRSNKQDYPFDLNKKAKTLKELYWSFFIAHLRAPTKGAYFSWLKFIIKNKVIVIHSNDCLNK